MSNKKEGTKLELNVAGRLFAQGFWVHLMTQDKSGQPADIIAVKDGQAYLIDAKKCSGNDFRLSRVEPNQHSAMRLWAESGNGFGWFAVSFDDEIYMASYYQLSSSSAIGRKSLSREWFIDNCHTLERWSACL